MKYPALLLLILWLGGGEASADDQVRRLQEALRKRNLYFGVEQSMIYQGGYLKMYSNVRPPIGVQKKVESWADTMMLCAKLIL